MNVRGRDNAEGQIREQTLETDIGAKPLGEHLETSPSIDPIRSNGVPILNNAFAEDNIVSAVA